MITEMVTEMVPLVSVCDFQGGTQPPKSEWVTKNEEGYIRMLQIRDFTQTRNEIEYVPKKGNLKICEEDDILIARYGASVGKIMTGLKGAYNVAIIKTIPDERKITKRYLYYYLKSNLFQNFIKTVGTRAAQAGFNKQDLEGLRIYLPSLDIQNKIVNLLDKTHSLIEKRKSQITELTFLTDSIYQEMFGDPILNSQGFRYVKLKDITTKITDGTHHSPPMVDKGYPYISAKHLGSGRLDFYKNPSYISEDDHNKIFQRCNPEKGDVLYIKDGATTGIAAINIYDFPFSMLSSLALIKCNTDKLNNNYLVYYLNNRKVKEKILNNMSGGAIKRLTLKKINDIDVILPPIELQKEFANIIEKIEEKKQLFNQGLLDLENTFNSLVQLSFNGEIFNE